MAHTYQAQLAHERELRFTTANTEDVSRAYVIGARFITATIQNKNVSSA